MTLLRNCIITFFVFFIIVISIILCEIFISNNRTINITKISRSHCGISPMGPPGEIGPRGDTGDDGARGQQGPYGFEGKQGISYIGPTGPTGIIGKNSTRPKLQTLDGNVLNNLFESYSIPQAEDEIFLELTGAEEKINYIRPGCPVSTETSSILGKGYMFGLYYNDIPKCYKILSTINIGVDKNYINRLENVNGSYYNINFVDNYYWATVYLVYGDYNQNAVKNLYLLSETNYLNESIPICLLSNKGTLFSNVASTNTLSTGNFNSIPIRYAFLNPAIKGGYGFSTYFEFDKLGVTTRLDNYDGLHTTEEPMTQRFTKGSDYVNTKFPDFKNRIWIYPYIKYISFLPIVNYTSVTVDTSLYLQKKIIVSWANSGALSYKILILDINNEIIFNNQILNGDQIVLSNHTVKSTYILYVIGIFQNNIESMKSRGVQFELNA